MRLDRPPTGNAVPNTEDYSSKSIGADYNVGSDDSTAGWITILVFGLAIINLTTQLWHLIVEGFLR